MSTSVAISSAALVQSSIAAAEAAAARKTACVNLIQSYDSKSADQSAMQAYAGCVNTVYPRELPHSDVVALKIAVVLLIIAGCIGAYKMFKEPYGGGISDAAMGFLAGLLIGGLVLLIVGLLWWVIS